MPFKIGNWWWWWGLGGLGYFPVQAIVHRYLQPQRDFFVVVMVWNCTLILNFVDWNRIRFFALWKKGLRLRIRECMLLILYYFGISGSQEQGWSKGWRSGESAHLPPMWPGFKSWRWSHFSPLLREIFLWFSRFPFYSKTNTSKFQFDLECMDTFKQVHKNS